MDIRVVEENKQKYLNMLTTKLFLNEEEVVGLTKSSGKKFLVICPFCLKQRLQRYADTSVAGHTVCCSCSKSIRTVVPLLGIKKDRLLPFDFGEHFDDGKKSYYKVKAVCDCGVVKDYVSGVFKGVYNVSSCGCLLREFMSAKVGELSPTWNPNLTEEQRKRNNGREGQIKAWRNAVKHRDNFTCQVCGSTEKPVAHHLNSYASAKDRRYDIENGVTMCRDCHTDFHTNFLENYRVPCNEQDFEDYLLQV